MSNSPRAQARRTNRASWPKSQRGHKARSSRPEKHPRKVLRFFRRIKKLLKGI